MKSDKSKKKQSESPKDAGTTSVLDSQNETLAKKLISLNQQWNPVLKCAIDFLRAKNQDSKPCAWLVDFPYAAFVYREGSWQHNDLPAEVKGAAIGIVLSGRVEVVIEAVPPAEGQIISPVRPRPCVILSPGAIVGSFEYADRFVHSVQAYGYSLMAGPVCVQFDHGDYFAFSKDRAGYLALEKVLSKINKTEDAKSYNAKSQYLQTWEQTGENYYLIKAFADAQELMKSHATVLVISIDDVSGSTNPHTLALHRAVMESAWKQSGSSRVRTFPNQRGSLLSSVGKIDANHAQDIHSTLSHVDAALQNKMPVWTPFDAKLHTAPAVDSFCERLGVENIERVQLKPGAVYISSNLSETDRFGAVSLADYLVKGVLETKGNKAWKLCDELASGQMHKKNTNEETPKTALPKIEIALKGFLLSQTTDKKKSLWFNRVRLRSWGDQNGYSGRPIELAKAADANPFSRLQIEMSSHLEPLEVLQKVTDDWLLPKEALSGVLIVACQHLLKETECWFSHLKEINANVEIFTIGKDYSTCPHIARQLVRMGVNLIESLEWNWELGCYNDYLLKKANELWSTVEKRCSALPSISKILILDDGGFLISTLPKSLQSKFTVVAVEQTQSGVERAKSAKIPFVNVAECHVKKQVESHLIAKTTLQKAKVICRGLCDKNAKIGIIGSGAVGATLAQHLLDSGYSHVKSYDLDPKKRNFPHSVQTSNKLISECDIFFGCSGGESVIAEADLRSLASKWFISCSSSDIEFKSLLKSKNAILTLPYDKFSTVHIRTNSQLPAKVLNGGFPVNFDRTAESVPLNEIQLTRGLMHAGLIQALGQLDKKNPNPLTNQFQRNVLNAWLESERGPSEELKTIGKNARNGLQ
jgi:S-adenosylhomocysteine hydrolase